VAVEGTFEERLHAFIDFLAQFRDLALRDAGEPHRLRDLVDPARRHPADPGLLDDGDQRLFRRLARLQEWREVAASPQLRDLEVERAKPRVERAVAVAVRMMSSVKPCGSPQSDVWGSLASGQARDAINSYPVGQADPGALCTACKR